MSEYQQHVYAVDDDPDFLHLLESYVKTQPISLTTQSNPQLARLHLQTDMLRYDAILLDWNMPGLSGLEILRELRQQSPSGIVPVILLTARTDPVDIEHGIEHGALYYVTKPVQKKELIIAIYNVVRQSQKLRALGARHQSILPVRLLEEARFQVRTLQDVYALEKSLAALADDSLNLALGLNELLTNAIEHGNLGIDYHKKTQMIQSGDYTERLQQLALRSDKRAYLTVRIAKDRTEFEIRDQGAGFDFQNYLSLSPVAALESHGRGIHIANQMCFDELEYQAPGNRVIARLKRGLEL
ncbi:MAG: response regulator [Leptospiraceae bacterium]|nr:response regulator [Leptospiraceae bacterium]